MRSVIFDACARPCLTDGRHPPGSEAERECPVIRRRLQEAAKSADLGVDKGSPKVVFGIDMKSAASDTAIPTAARRRRI